VATSPQPPPAQGGTYGPGAPPPPRPSRGGLLVVTLTVAVLALVVGVAGVILSAIALGHADKTTALPVDLQLPATTEAPRPTDPATSNTTDPVATATGGDISPTAAFVIKYQSEHLRVQTESCDTVYRTGIDLDEPRVVGDDGDITYGGCTPGNIQTELPFAEIPSQDATAADCLEKIRTAPGLSPVAPSNGQSFCYQTSQDAAVAQGITQKIVIVTIDSISKNSEHGVLNITLKAWNVPA
jgi:hypothetical protein